MKPVQPALQYLLFEQADDGLGIVTLEAVASVRSERLPALYEEWRRIIEWAQQTFPGQQGPVDDGYLWDSSVTQTLSDGGWHTLTFTLIGSAVFVEALDACFGLSG